MLGKISIIAGIERTVSSCAMGLKKVCSPLVEGKLPITINWKILDPSNEYIISKNMSVRSVKEHWSPSLPAIGNWWDPAGWKSRYCLNDKALWTSYCYRRWTVNSPKKTCMTTSHIKVMTTTIKSWMNNHLITGRTPNFTAFAQTKPYGNITNNKQSSPLTCTWHSQGP